MKPTLKHLAPALVATLGMAVTAAPAFAEEEPAGVSLELNKLADAASGCTLTFLVSNGQAADIDQAVWEAVLFDRGGQVDRLTLFDFGELPAGRPRVRQFVVPDLTCGNLGQVLLNGVHACTAPEGTACDTGLTLKSRTDADLNG
ncbi:MAG: hypothetical protein AAF761_03820 [Pseudomonadota bacterium]